MDNNLTSVPPSTVSPELPTHKKLRWIIVFVACLVVIVAVLSILRQDDAETLSPEEEARALLERMTATGPSVISEQEASVLQKVMTGTNKSVLSAEETQRLNEVMSAKVQ